MLDFNSGCELHANNVSNLLSKFEGISNQKIVSFKQEIE